MVTFESVIMIESDFRYTVIWNVSFTLTNAFNCVYAAKNAVRRVLPWPVFQFCWPISGAGAVSNEFMPPCKLDEARRGKT